MQVKAPELLLLLGVSVRGELGFWEGRCNTRRSSATQSLMRAHTEAGALAGPPFVKTGLTL